MKEYHCTRSPVGEAIVGPIMDSVKDLTTRQGTHHSQSWHSLEFNLVGRSNKSIHVRVQDSHGIREYLKVQARAYIPSKGMVHNIQSKQPRLQA
jgi:hypothetical protein